MDISELLIAFGAYYEQAGQNVSRIKRLLTQGIETPKICTPLKTDDTIYRLSQINMTRIVQPFQQGWTPINSAAFTPNELRLFQFKVDQDIQPDFITASWLGFLDSNSLTKKDYPLVRYLIENNLIPFIQNDMDFADIGKLLTDGKNLGGLAQRIYFGLWYDVLTWPTDPSGPASLELAGAQIGDLIMKPGKRMFELYTTEDAAKLDINVIGEEAGKGYELLLHVFAPGLHKKLLGFMNATKNEDLVFIAMDSAGQNYLLGCEIRSAKFSASDGSGTGSTTDGRRGFGMTFAFRAANIYVYTGKIPLTEALGSA